MILEQGDVLLFLEEITEKYLKDLKDPILEHGEHTGHAHRLHGDGFTHLINEKTKERFLRVLKPTEITHEEHNTITISPGEYRIGRIREVGMFDDVITPVVD